MVKLMVQGRRGLTWTAVEQAFAWNCLLVRFI